MKLRPLLWSLFGTALISSAAAGDFDGRWTLDKSRSELSGRLKTNQAEIEQAVTVACTQEVFTVTNETVGGPRTRVEATDTYPLDGKSHAFTPAARTGSGAATGDRTAKIAPDGRSITILENVTRDMPGGKVTVHNEHTWTLSADGKTLTAVSVIRGPRGETPTRRVFVRTAEREARAKG